MDSKIQTSAQGGPERGIGGRKATGLKTKIAGLPTKSSGNPFFLYLIYRQNMYKDIPIELKKEAIKKVILEGQPIKRVAQAYKVNRNSLHTWIKRTRIALEEALTLQKRGPKITERSFRKKQWDIKNLRVRLTKKREKIRELESQISQYKHNNGKEVRPEKCFVCGCEKTYKNGRYQISDQTLISLIKKSSLDKFTMQQFICSCCNRRVGLKLDTAIMLNK